MSPCGFIADPTQCSVLRKFYVLSLTHSCVNCNIATVSSKVHIIAKFRDTSINAIFISHTHMVHFMGMDSVIRHSHASHRTIDIFGPPGLCARAGHKFACYNWNLAETFWGNFRIGAVSPGRIISTLYC
jgi:ribonuclease BN (tRNA processing enzyme)